MAFTVSLRVGCRAGNCAPTTHAWACTHDDLVTCMAEALSQLDRQVIESIVNAPLGVEGLSIDFGFSTLVPRNRLVDVWIQSVHRLNEVISLPIDHPHPESDMRRRRAVKLSPPES